MEVSSVWNYLLPHLAVSLPSTIKATLLISISYLSNEAFSVWSVLTDLLSSRIRIEQFSLIFNRGSMRLPTDQEKWLLPGDPRVSQNQQAVKLSASRVCTYLAYFAYCLLSMFRQHLHM
jgi:hypothetical protein